MGFEDRDYSRRPGSGGGVFRWILNGSIPLFTFSGIRVRAHSSMVLLIAFVLLLGLGTGFGLQDRVISMTVLFGVVLLHEFGHAFAARAVGGSANDILLTPLGGLAFCETPRRPLPTFIAVVCGPLVNVVLLLGAAVVIYATGNKPQWNPLASPFTASYETWSATYSWSAWFFSMNYWLLLFNLLPSYPLDGGRLLQTALWKPMGFYRSTLAAATVGIFGGAGMIVFGLLGFQLLLAFIGLSCILTCVSMRQQLLAAGPYAFQEDEPDYSAASWSPNSFNNPAAAKESENALKRQAAAAATDAAEQAHIDRILEKVSQKGMHSLNFLEKRKLKQATERQRQRTLRGRG